MYNFVMNNKFNIYFHIALAQNWKQSFDRVNGHLIESGILNDCENVIYSVNGDISVFEEYARKTIVPNVSFLGCNTFHEEFEFPTINILKRDLEKEDVKALYIMTKSATTPFTQQQKDHIDVMSWFNIHKYKDCLELLDEYDAVGVDYHDLPYKHFSGNFFWTKSSHAKKLPYLYWEPWRNYAQLGEERHAAEAWVCKPEGKYYSLHNTGIPVYERHLHEYPQTKYK